MKVCIYFEAANNITKSGIGRAFKHQVAMCESLGIDYTTNYKDTYDILHINTIFLKSSEAMKYARKQGAKIIYHAHSTKEDFEDSFKLSNAVSPVFKKWLIHLYSKADMIITPTPYSKKLLVGYGIKVPVYVLSNGIDVSKYASNSDYEQEFRDYFKLNKDDIVFFSVGLWFRRKGILDFIKLARELPEYKFIWFGYINKNSITSDVSLAMKNAPSNCLFPGYIAGNVIKGAYSGANGFIFMSYEETEGIVVLESLASKQATIIRDIPVYDEWLQNNVNCLKAKSIQDFKDKLLYLTCNDPTDLKEAGYQVAFQRDFKVIEAQLKELYEMVLRS